jgi:hypothetical protein
MAYLPSVVLCYHCCRQWHLSVMGSFPGVDINGEMTASIPVLLDITYGKSFLPGEAHPMVESS